MKPTKVIPLRDREVAARRRRLQRQIVLQELLLSGVALVLFVVGIVMLF